MIAHKFGAKHRTDDVLVSEKVTFEELLLSRNVLSGLKISGFHKPSPIQLKAIPLGRCGLDLVVQAKSGTGKTCVFSVIALESLEPRSSSLQVVILAPTREIALQIHSVVSCIGQDIEGLKAEAFIGGTQVSEDRVKAKKCQIAIGSPGRLKQLIQLGVLVTSNVRMFVLDEADKLVEEGSFQKQINWIYSSLPTNKQIIALSATYPEALAEFLTHYMREPTYVRLNPSQPSLLGLQQYYIVVQKCSLPHLMFEEKTKHVIDILSNVSFQQTLIFSNYHSRAESICEALNYSGWPTTFISGNMEQSRRIEAIEKLKQFQCRVLISTDLTSRGIDAHNVDMVINMDVPCDWETYMHRIGRAGRFGSRGIAVSLVSAGDEEVKLHSLAARCSASISPLKDIKTLEDRDQLSTNETNEKLNGVEQSVTEVIDMEASNQAPEFEDQCKSMEKLGEENSINVATSIPTNNEDINKLNTPVNNESCTNGTMFVENKATAQSRQMPSFDEVFKKNVPLPKILSLKELMEKGPHRQINTHYRYMNLDQMKSDLDYYLKNRTFAPASSYKLENVGESLESDMSKLNIDSNTNQHQALVATESDVDMEEDSSITDVPTTSSYNAEEPIVSSKLHSDNYKPATEVSAMLKKNDVEKSTRPQTSNVRTSLKRHPQSAAAGIDLLRHWNAFDRSSQLLGSSSTVPANKQETAKTKQTSGHTSQSSIKVCEKTLVSDQNVAKAHCSKTTPTDRNAKNIDRNYCIANASNVHNNSYSLNSNYTDTSTSDDGSSSEEYSSDEESEASATSEDTYKARFSNYCPVHNSRTKYNRRQFENIKPPPILYPFGPTGHYFSSPFFVSPPMYAYNDTAAAKEAMFAHSVFQHALQHVKNQLK